MPVKKCKCLNCEKRYNAYVYPDPKLGISLKEYPCPKCGNSKKALIVIKEKKEEVKGWDSINREVLNKKLC